MENDRKELKEESISDKQEMIERMDKQEAKMEEDKREMKEKRIRDKQENMST